MGKPDIAISFTPPQITVWDRSNLEGRIKTKDRLPLAKTLIPKMKKEGADIIIALNHGGIETSPLSSDKGENQTVALSQVEGIDAIVSGHQHEVFPGESFAKLKRLGIDSQGAKLNGKPTVMPGAHGSHLGVIILDLKYADNRWNIARSSAKVEPVKGVSPDKKIAALAKNSHEATLNHLNASIGETKIPLNTFFARISDSAVLQLINDAQRWFLAKELKSTRYRSLPILSAAAPFRAGHRSKYTDIPIGKLAIKDISSLYPYPNTLTALLLTGRQLTRYLERTAENFNQLPKESKGDFLILNASFRSYSFDVVDGITYEIDISQPKGKRIKKVRFNGKLIPKSKKFILATNNYRAFGGGAFPNAVAANVVLASTVENRDIVIDYIKAKKTVNPKPDNNWRLTPFSKEKVVALFLVPEGQQQHAPKNMVLYRKKIAPGMDGYRLVFDKN